MTHYSVTFRTLSNDLTGVVLTGFRDGIAINRMNVAAVKLSALMPLLNEIRRSMAAKGIAEAR